MSQPQSPFTGPPIADDPHLSALLREPVRLGEGCEPQGWQLIGTAPEGQWVLLWTDDGWYVGFLKRGDGQWHIDTDAETIGNPTHWQPLPAPPQ